MVKRNETKVTNPSAGSKAQESESHDLVKEPSFPLGSIGEGKSWQVEGDYEYQEEGGSPYVGLYPEAFLWQDITLPVEANPTEDGRPDFWLGCEYDTGRLSDCRLEIYDFTGGKEGPRLQERVMEGIEPDVSPSDALVNWTRLPLERIENLVSTVTAIRIKFIAGKGNNRLSLRNIDLDVRLPALAATLSLVVDPDGLKIEQTVPPYKFCHGAVHRFGISEVKTDSWLHQKASLSWHGETLPTEFALQANPPFNRGVPDEDSFQPLEDVTAWTVSSNAKTDANSGALALGISSYWQAEIREVAASVGDYVNDMSTIAGGDTALIIDDENANKATLTTTVFNHFTSERKVEKIPVEWRVNGRLLGTVPTDQHGQSQIDYQPEKGDEGDANQAEITAIARNELGEDSRQGKTLRVFTTTPWLDQVQVLLDDKEVDLKNLGLHLSRGDKARKLVLKPKAIPGNFFIGRDVTLTSPEGSAGKLGISFEPSTARKMPEGGLEWLIEGGSTSGLFAFEANATGLAAPFVLKGVQMSQSLSDEADLTVPYAAFGDDPVFWRTQAGTVALVPKKGSPLASLGLETWLTFVKVNLEQSSIPASPAYAQKRSLPAAGLQWSLTGGAASGFFGLEFHVESFTQPWVVSKALLLSQNLNDEAEIQAPKLPMVCVRGTAKEVNVAAKAGSPLKELGLKGVMTFLAGTVAQTDTTALPAYGTANPFTPEGKLTWALTGTKGRGTFGLEVAVEGFSTPLQLKVGEAMLLSDKLIEEADIKVESKIPVGTVVFNRQKAYQVELVPKVDSALGLAGLVAILTTSLSTEPKGEREIPAAGLKWTVTAPNSSLEFSLKFKVGKDDAYTISYDDCVVLSENLINEAELEVEGSNKGGIGYFWRNTEGGIRLVPRTGSPLKGGALKATLTFVETQGGFGKAQLGANPNYEVPQAITDTGSRWTLSPKSSSGYFELQVTVDGFETPLRLSRGMILSKNLGDEIALEHPRNPKAEPKVFFFDSPTNVRMVYKGGSPLYLATDLNVSLSFVNKGLPATQMRAEPSFDSKAPINGANAWALTAGSERGLFGLKLIVDKFDSPLEWPVCGTLSENFLDEFEVSRSSGWLLVRGAREELTVKYDAAHMLALGAKLTIYNSLENEAALFSPTVGVAMSTHSSGTSIWYATGSTSKSGAGVVSMRCSLYPAVQELCKLCVRSSSVWNDIEFSYKGRVLARGETIDVPFSVRWNSLSLRPKWPGFDAFVRVSISVFRPGASIAMIPVADTVMSFIDGEVYVSLNKSSEGQGALQFQLHVDLSMGPPGDDGLIYRS
ncbi:hypothetical protein [Pseudomonas sp. NBRC 111124]|uniref:hypothetical protein n=1 Tax=Pseudomonas sp. NBRC 111124 TaxID=1661039 RepID=UPI00076113A9|nr:hypothetical protein [Pseudomonas sp. NBRC 111124]